MLAQALARMAGQRMAHLWRSWRVANFDGEGSRDTTSIHHVRRLANGHAIPQLRALRANRSPRVAWGGHAEILIIWGLVADGTENGKHCGRVHNLFPADHLLIRV
jgi:hypothetical protein